MICIVLTLAKVWHYAVAQLFKMLAGALYNKICYNTLTCPDSLLFMAQSEVKRGICKPDVFAHSRSISLLSYHMNVFLSVPIILYIIKS